MDFASSTSVWTVRSRRHADFTYLEDLPVHFLSCYLGQRIAIWMSDKSITLINGLLPHVNNRKFNKTPLQLYLNNDHYEIMVIKNEYSDITKWLSVVPIDQTRISNDSILEKIEEIDEAFDQESQ